MGRRRLVPKWVPAPSLTLVGVAFIVVGLLASNVLDGLINRVALLIVQLIFFALALLVMAWVGRYLLRRGRV